MRRETHFTRPQVHHHRANRLSGLRGVQPEARPIAFLLEAIRLIDSVGQKVGIGQCPQHAAEPLRVVLPHEHLGLGARLVGLAQQSHGIGQDVRHVHMEHDRRRTWVVACHLLRRLLLARCT